MNEQFGIGEAVKEMRNGNRVQRVGWNGKGMWLALQVPDPMSKMGGRWQYCATTGQITLPYVYMKTADDKLVPWLCSQTDLLATDWMLV